MINLVNMNWTYAALIVIIIALFGIWYQVKKIKDLKEGLFVLKLNTTFSESENIQRVYKKLELYRQENNKVFTKEDIPEIAIYLSFFEVIYSLVEKKIIRFKTLDRLFSLRFFLIVNNPYVQTYLMEDDEHYKTIIKLYEKWVYHRKNNKLSEPFKENSLFIVLGRKKYPPQ